MDFLIDALIDSLKILPILLVGYILVEILETLTSKSTKKLSLGKAEVLVGSSLGLIPQCGFSVIATDLFSRAKITMGTLVAIYVATSDEAFVVLLSNPDKAIYLLPLIGLKFAFALLFGYTIYMLELSYKKKHQQAISTEEIESAHDDNDEEEHVHIGCHGHHIEEGKAENTTKARLKRYLLHPILHTLYIFLFVLAVNLIFSTIVHFITEERLESFLMAAKPFTPLLSLIIGLVPNCASSVVLTQMFVSGALPFGAMLTGLIMNAGIAVTVLFKQNKNIKQNFLIIGLVALIALVAGYSMLYVL